MPVDELIPEDNEWVNELIQADGKTALLSPPFETSPNSTRQADDIEGPFPSGNKAPFQTTLLPSLDLTALEGSDELLARASLLLVVVEKEESTALPAESELDSVGEVNLLLDHDLRDEDAELQPHDAIDAASEGLREGEIAHSLSDVEESLSNVEESTPEKSAEEEFSSLMATFDESDDVPPIAPLIPPPAAAIVEPTSTTDKQQVSCPAGTPSPKISMAALQRAKKEGAEEAAGSVARLFGGEAPPAKEPEVHPVPPPKSLEPAPASVEKLPRVLPIPLRILDRVTDRIRQSNQHLPLILGALGVLMLAHGIMTFVLAGMGWI